MYVMCMLELDLAMAYMKQELFAIIVFYCRVGILGLKRKKEKECYADCNVQLHNIWNGVRDEISF